MKDKDGSKKRGKKGGGGRTDLCEGLVEDPGAEQFLILGVLYLLLAGRVPHLDTKESEVVTVPTYLHIYKTTYLLNRTGKHSLKS